MVGGPPGAPLGPIGYVPQKIDFDRTIPLTVRDLLNFFSSRAERRDQNYRAGLESVGAFHLLNRRLGDLSGGEFQRVMMGLALHRAPQLLILDEAAAGVDMEGEAVFYEILNELRAKQNLTVVLVSHDLSVVYQFATQVLCINHALVCHGRPQEVLTADTLGRLYGHGAVYHHPERPHPTMQTK